MGSPHSIFSGLAGALVLLSLTGCATPESAPADSTPPEQARDVALTDSEAAEDAAQSGAEASVRPGVNDGYFAADSVEPFVNRFEAEKREVVAEKAKILEVLRGAGLKEGARVADIGSGTGLFVRDLSAAVGEQGRLYAVDIVPSFLERLRGIAEQEGLSSMQVVEADAKSVGLEANSVDLALMSDVYHHIEFPQTYMSTVREALAPDGRLVLVDFHRIEGVTSARMMKHVRAGQEEVLEELRLAGFELVKEHDWETLEENYLLELRVADTASSAAS